MVEHDLAESIEASACVMDDVASTRASVRAHVLQSCGSASASLLVAPLMRQNSKVGKLYYITYSILNSTLNYNLSCFPI